MPKKLTIKVGTIKMSEITVKRFMTMFRLFEITEANASIMPERMSLYVSAISIACRLSMATSSSQSLSSSSKLSVRVLLIFSSKI